MEVERNEGKKRVKGFGGRNLFGNIVQLFLEPDLEAFKPSAGRSKSLFTHTPAQCFLTEKNDLHRQHSALSSSEIVKNATFLSANRTESLVTAPISNISAVSQAYITRDE